MGSGCSLSGSGVARGKTCPRLVLKTGKKLVLQPGQNTEARFAGSPVCLLLQLYQLLSRSGKVFFHQRKMEESRGLNGADTTISKHPTQILYGERRGQLKERIAQEKH